MTNWDRTHRQQRMSRLFIDRLSTPSTKANRLATRCTCIPRRRHHGDHRRRIMEFRTRVRTGQEMVSSPAERGTQVQFREDDARSGWCHHIYRKGEVFMLSAPQYCLTKVTIRVCADRCIGTTIGFNPLNPLPYVNITPPQASSSPAGD